MDIKFLGWNPRLKKINFGLIDSKTQLLCLVNLFGRVTRTIISTKIYYMRNIYFGFELIFKTS
ncbi:hypothetical protein BpHYR1_004209 [Brachionus plicatilis]|uniref:Uncharacterized protein n=1 Tax=Brachionus plicatilis TaxID=10195 RepID=A0A3M7R1B8_BRAPC|nr:hypothetical protein BpHYR1_004209 [Brachionus plicatilis]